MNISQSDCDMWQKVGFYTTTGNNLLSDWTEKKLQSTFQSQTCTKRKVMVPVWRSADGLIQLSECQWNHDIWEAVSTHQWDAPKPTMPAAMVKRKGPILLHTWLHITQPMLPKLNKLGYEVLPHWPYSPDLSSTDYHFFKHLDNFLQGKCFHKQQEAENAFPEFLNSWSMDSYAIGINKHFSLAKLRWL